MRAPVMLVVALCVAVTILVACAAAPRQPARLRVLASSELTDMAPLLADLRAKTGIELIMNYQGTVDPSHALIPGGYRYDVAWLSTDRYFLLNLRKFGYPGPPPLSNTIMLSPVVVGVSKPAARRLQIAQRSVSWADLAQLASAGELRFAMGDPRHTGDGLAALIGVANATAATGAALRPENVTCEHLHGFLTGDKLSADTSAGLIDEFISHQHELDALVGYESVLLSLNDSGRLPEPLEIIYPADGIVWSNYPMLLLDPAKRAAYDRAVTWLRSAPVQRQIMELTARRPIDPAIVRNTRLLAMTGNALYFPDESEVIDRLLATYDSLLATKEFHGCP